MRAPSPVIAEAIARIAARPEGALVLEYLQTSMTETQQALIQMEDPHKLRMLQGQGQALTMLLKYWKP